MARKFHNPYERYDIFNLPKKVNIFVTLPFVTSLMAFFILYAFRELGNILNVILSIIATYICFLIYQSCVSFACLRYVNAVKKEKNEEQIERLKSMADPVTQSLITALRLADTDDPVMRAALHDLTFEIQATENYKPACKAWCEAMREIGIIKG